MLCAWLPTNVNLGARAVAFCCVLVQAYLQLRFNRLVDNPRRAPAHRADAKNVARGRA
jgi:hypothetical protein